MLSELDIMAEQDDRESGTANDLCGFVGHTDVEVLMKMIEGVEVCVCLCTVVV